MQRLTFLYLGSYLVVGGLGFLLLPEFTMRLLLADGSYGDVMPRLVGVFMAALGGAVVQFLRAGDYRVLHLHRPRPRAHRRSIDGAY